MAIVTSQPKLLTGSRVYLRPINGEDAGLYYEQLYVEETRRLTGTHKFATKEQICRYIEAKSQDSSCVLLLIALKESDEVIGDIALQDIDTINRSAGIRIAISYEQHQGQGFGQEAMLLLLDYGFGVLNLQRIELEVFTFNARAAHVYEKLGFVREGIKRKALYYHHQYHDVITMSMLADEYRSKYCISES
ncbi:GNAT family N-acetyltransferase [Paenibacillus sp. SC116]|uniref:GNAT family N-acetyltransferase n=1 Tax=Paenibacillus sp. SC116 TaxID=2968986 RepID=UPI00215B419D|nr:GNAT family protein [Paenibacillus sp. SC116]MCR8845000.1 GNAT family N-acetyltransferase [Paenibacillus sp. SC116]